MDFFLFCLEAVLSLVYMKFPPQTTITKEENNKVLVNLLTIKTKKLQYLAGVMEEKILFVY